ncbi:hypothetical protein ACFLZP_01645 [Patescibacteria group bacterium]
MALDDKQNTTTESPKGVNVKDIIRAVRSCCALPKELIKVVLAVCISVKLDLPSSLWLMIVGVPSSAKTDLVNFLRGSKLTYFIDTLTQNPFASGYVAPKGGKTYDLLPELDNRCFVCKDFTTIFSLNDETVRKLLGELVSIYDGEFRKFSPTRGLKEYSANFSHIGCITPSALNRHSRYMNIIGPRFMFYRIPKLSVVNSKKGFKIAWQTDRKIKLKKVQETTSLFLNQISNNLKNKNIEVDFSDKEVKSRLEDLSIFTSKSRGIVVSQRQSFKNEEGKEIVYYEIIDHQTEEPWRAFQQLKGLAIALSLISGTNKVSREEINILKKVVFSSMPVQRAEALECFKKESVLTARKLSILIKKSQRTCQRLLKELQFLGIVKVDDSDNSLAKEYRIRKRYADLFIGNHPSEFVSSLGEELKNDFTTMIRMLLFKDLSLISDSDLGLYLKEIEKWLTDKTDRAGTEEYDFTHSIWEKVRKEMKKRQSESVKQDEFTDSDKRYINQKLV